MTLAVASRSDFGRFGFHEAMRASGAGGMIRDLCVAQGGTEYRLGWSSCSARNKAAWPIRTRRGANPNAKQLARAGETAEPF
jgi:hypothetical protein